MIQRIMERRAALDAKIKAKRAREGGEGTRHEEHEEKKGGGGDEEMKAARRRLAILKATASEAVSRFRVATDAHENERRIRQEAIQRARDLKIRDEKASSQTRQATIQMAYDTLHKTKIPHDLAQKLEHQKEDCNKVIDVKGKLIEEFRLQMREKEEEYVSALKQQAEDIEQLLQTMHEQTNTVSKAYVEELQAVEKAFEEERRQLLLANEAEIDALVNQRSRLEKENNKRREARVREDQLILDQKYEENAEKYNQCKLQYQHNIHGLAQELERMRALYLLNAERLNYNLQVLRERLRENEKAIAQHKRKTSRLQDVLSGLIAKHNETDKRFRQANTELTQSYRRVTEQYKDLQLKFQHFEKADVEKYRQVWAMHESDCMKLVHKCLQGDRVVFEELLGVPWVPPSLDFWLTTGADESERLKEEEEKAANDDTIELTDTARTMLQVVYKQAPFLVDEKTRQAIKQMDPEEADTYQIEAVLSVLNIKKTEEVNNMLDYFLTEADDGTTALINPQEAVQALQRFLDDRRKHQAAKADSTGKDVGETAISATGRTKSAELEKRRNERLFWERMANVVPEDHLRVWIALEHGLDQYLEQLQKRQAMIDKTDAIRKQNDELRALLNQYLGSRLNEELFAPPQIQVLPTSSA
jgi:dynein regulatory complex protein 1